MESRRRLYVAGLVGGSMGYIFSVLAFTGRFSVVEWAVFMVVFALVFYFFDRFIEWSETLDAE